MASNQFTTERQLLRTECLLPALTEKLGCRKTGSFLDLLIEVEERQSSLSRRRASDRRLPRAWETDEDEVLHSPARPVCAADPPSRPAICAI
jgi:hypothetical protein